MIKYFKQDNPDNLLTIEGTPDIICRKFGVCQIEVLDPKDVEIAQYRREYLDTIKMLVELAGEEYNGKLENFDFKRIALKVSDNPKTGILIGFLAYHRDVLRELDGEKWFENISGM